jgi:hypothetical protein
MLKTVYLMRPRNYPLYHSAASIFNTFLQKPYYILTTVEVLSSKKYIVVGLEAVHLHLGAAGGN